MVELTPIEEIVVKAMKELGATSENSLKTADDIMRKCNRPKGQVNNALLSLVQKGIVVRKVREKAAGYYLKENV
jgi:predicted transcriptional regulator